MANDKHIHVEVAFALPEQQEIIAMTVGKGCSAREAVEKSGIANRFPDINLKQVAMGIFSRRLNGIELPAPENYVLEEGDRVEIYRDLLVDPKQARLERAKKNKK